MNNNYQNVNKNSKNDKTAASKIQGGGSIKYFVSGILSDAS
jgi:hypothetical protein